MDQAPSMMGHRDSDLRCRFANEAYQAWLGVDPAALVGRSLQDLLGPALFALDQLFVRLASLGHVQTFERLLPGPGGQARHSLSHCLPDTVDGRVQGFIAHVTDITALKRTQSAMRQTQRIGRIGSRERHAARDAVTWSDQLQVLFGRDPSQPAPSFQEHERLYTPASWSRLQAAVQAAMSDGRPCQLALEFVRADGSTGTLEARGEVLRDAAARISGLHGAMQDVSGNISEGHRAGRAAQQRGTPAQPVGPASSGNTGVASRRCWASTRAASGWRCRTRCVAPVPRWGWCSCSNRPMPSSASCCRRPIWQRLRRWRARSTRRCCPWWPTWHEIQA